jgi:hypothetical protein
MTRALSPARPGRWFAANAVGTFPDNLSPAELKAVQAVAEHGCRFIAADQLGIKTSTICTQLQLARQKAGADTTLRLVALYLQATKGNP